MSKTAIERLLSNHGFELARQRKHKVYKRDDGTTFVTASTPSDRRAQRNQLAELTHVLGMDKHTLLGSLEKRRRRIRTPKPVVPVIEAVAPHIVIEPRLSKQDRQLSKRLARIERNHAAKTTRRSEQLWSFFDSFAVWFVDTDEIVFADHRGPKRLHRSIVRRLERPEHPSFALADRYQELSQISAEELLTNPDLLCLFNCPRCGLTFVFRDGSIIESNRQNALELRENWVEKQM